MRICRSVWKVSSQPVKEAHFATFPMKLIERPIKAGCPELVCTGKNSPVKTIRTPVKKIDRSKIKLQDRGFPKGLMDGALKLTQEYNETLVDGCGKPVVPVIDVDSISSGADYVREKHDGMYGYKKHSAGQLPVRQPTTTATHCSCGAEFRKGIVLDPFMGSGTTAIVARALDRDFVGIELNPEYIEIAKKRMIQWPKARVLKFLKGESAPEPSNKVVYSNTLDWDDCAKAEI